MFEILELINAKDKIILNLPVEYVNSIKEILGDELESYLDSFEMPRTFGVRFNSLKVTEPDTIIKKYGLKFGERIPWTSNGYYYDEDYRPAKEPCYYAGLYYLQDPSAMCPAQVLNVRPGDMVLDMCAAPGGKSTEIISKLKERGILVSNDMSASRCKALIKNLELWGSRNVIVTSEDASSLSDQFEGFFDKILLDVPCSGEGMFRKEPKMVGAWKEHGPDHFAPIQKNLIDSAFKMLKPGGYMVYSTCTYSPKEDEEVLGYLLDKHPEICIVPFGEIDGALSANPVLAFGHEDVKNAVKFFAHRLKGEGQFVSMLHKRAGVINKYDAMTGNEPYSYLPNDRTEDISKDDKMIEDEPYTVLLKDRLGAIKDKNITIYARQFLERVGLRLHDKETIVLRGDCIYIQDIRLKDIKGLRILRNGLFLGTIKKNRFEPSQALAMALKPDRFDNVLKLSANDPRTLKYIKGETILLEATEEIKDGYVLICLEDYPLGWGKASNGSIKNKYLNSWRYE